MARTDKRRKVRVRDQGHPIVVGIGASAGGLGALKALFSAMPPKTGLVFVVVVHLEPTHESLMPELLSRVTQLTVEQARDRQPLVADHVYVIPPNRTMRVEQGLLRVEKVADRRDRRGVIDHFLRSLAVAERDRAVAIVLSGTGTEGTLGARAIKTESGLVIAQAPDTAAQPGMPQNVIAAGLVDVVLAPEKMPAALIACVRNPRAGHVLPARTESNAKQSVDDILAVSRSQTHRRVELPVAVVATADAIPPSTKSGTEPGVAGLADQTLLDHLAPAAIVVRSTGQIVRLYGAMERYIKLPKGEATLDVLSLARGALSPTLRAALRGAVRGTRQTVLDTVVRGRDRARATLRITVKPIHARSAAERLWLILFEEVAAAAGHGARKASRGRPDLVRRLEAEVRSTRKEQRQLVEDVESSNQELTAANEEVVSMNEELQSTNEELRTSKEELQSLNEELTTLNAQLQDKIHELTVVNDDLANLLVSTDIATVFLGTDLRIKRFTTAASHIFNLQRSDTGRPLSHLASNLIDAHLSRDAREVVTTETALEREVSARDGRRYILRILPYRAEGDAVQGVVLTLVDVTALKQIEWHLRAAREQLANDLHRMTRLHELSVQSAGAADLQALLDNVIRAAIDITAAEMGDIQRCDETGALKMVGHVGFERPFLDFFARVGADGHSPCAAAATARQRVLVEDVRTSPIFVGHPSLAVMAEAGARAVQSTPLFDRSGRFLGMFSTHYRTVHHFDEAECRWLDLLAGHAAGVLEQHAAEERLTRAHKELERRVVDRTRWLSLMHDVARAINEAATWDDALHRVLRRLCETEHWQIGYVYVPQPGHPETIVPVVSCFGDERFRPFHGVSMKQAYSRGDQLPGRVFAENEAFWASDTDALMAAIPLRADAAMAAGLRSGVDLPVTVRGEVVAVLEIFSDQPHLPDDQLITLMQNVGDQIGRVLERERATARMADLVWREQQELLHTLHDSLGQTLTGLGMLSAGLRQRLAASDAETAATAAEIANQSQRALDQVRRLSKSLFPVEVEAESLIAALRDLASATSDLHKVQVRVEGAAPIDVRDGKVATELYRIAQEAVTNSVKHAQAKAITIRLAGANGLTRLQVADDGVGIPNPEPTDGAGLRIMRYRAASIGASLAVERETAGGTVVTCTLRETPGSRKEPS